MDYEIVFSVEDICMAAFGDTLNAANVGSTLEQSFWQRE